MDRTVGIARAEGVAMMHKIRIAGSGGQGILIAGVILGKAASVYDGLWATQTQSYGPEARGGASKTDVIISDTEINYPFIGTCDILVCLSQLAYTKYAGGIVPGGTRIVDPDLVVHHADDCIPINASATAIELENPLVANMVMLGALSRLYPVVSGRALEEAISHSVSKRFVDIDIEALHRGMALAESLGTVEV